MNLGNYKKIIAFILGMGILFGVNHFNLSVLGLEGLALDLVIQGLTGMGVYQLTNEA